MVISDRLVWVHIPKTAGDATLAMFEELDVRFERIDAHTDPRKHQPLPELCAQGFEPGGRARIANLRRLPEVALSTFHHMQRHHPDARFASGQRYGAMRFADYVDYFLAHPETHNHDWLLHHFLGEREVDHWLRVDRLAESFAAVVGRYHELPEGIAERLRGIRANVGAYGADLASCYGREEMERLYRDSPRWSAAEKQVYGNLLFETMDWEG